ncbi:hypothetical protein K474DRAFT_1617849 [Panus rudis PR-1116 ss-1]|nr:hypothetical protein K474DRAFT_1617849 [Panus rudis PR-1116 ss-1]
MNSYPPELLAQLAPVMFVAGLEGISSANNSPQPPAQKSPDPFAVLSLRLREALTSQRKVAIWQPDKSKTFQVLLVDPDVRFPPRKIPPSEDQQFHTPHSPLSPLTPSSPLYPDGIIAPIWIRKHTTLVPSVFVLFKRLYEHPLPTARNPLESFEADAIRERESEERKRDAELSAEIAQRKKSMNERSIKLTVVLMASRRMLDDPTLDARLTHIRRQSGLDPRAALFVLSPVTQAEIGEFVKSLQEALWEPSIEYYANHSKRVRRKRNRHSQSNAPYPLTMASSSAPRPLRPEGWTVRYEFKMACFAEFRAEDDIALKHYHDAYSALHIMFGSTAILPPRTKRWAEAKVLADCISFKICKLYLYNNEHSLALAHHTTHMRLFSDLSRGWGIGEETFEYWSWVARQHRVFAELLEQGTRTSLKIPTHLPSVGANERMVSRAPDGTQRTSLEREAMRALGLNPMQALQHPGFYYYMAARCTEQRRDRFLKALDSDASQPSVSSSPGFINEKKVDHLTLVLELYTRAYELFKKYSAPSSQHQGQGRLTLWIAYRIAQTYYESGKFEMAVRFFERIAKTYRREQWDSLLRPLLSTWYACAQQLGDMELSVQLLLEILGHGPQDDQDDPEALEEDLMAVLKSTVPSTPDQALVVDLTESGPVLDTSAIFWKSEVSVGEAAGFQITLTAPPSVSLLSIPFTTLTIYLSDDLPPVTIHHAQLDADQELSTVQKVDVGNILIPPADSDSEDGDKHLKELEAHLRWNPGSSLVLCGSMTSTIPTTLTVSKLLLTLKTGTWLIELPLQPNSRRSGTTPNPKWLSSVNPPRFIPIQRDHYSAASVRHRPHVVHVSLAHHAPAYLGEEYPIVIDVTNGDDRDLDIVVDVLLQPTEIEEADNFITFDGQRSSSYIKGAQFGILKPGVSASKTLYLGTLGAVGDRTIDISVQSRAGTSLSSSSSSSPVSPNAPQSPAIPVDSGETLRTLVVPTVEPITTSHSVSYRRSTKPLPGLGELDTFENGYWEDDGEADVVMTFAAVGPAAMKVERVKLIREDGPHAKVLHSLVEDSEGDFITEWLTGEEFCDNCQVSLSRPSDPEAISGPGTYEISWRRMFPLGKLGSLTTSRFKLPSLQPPTSDLVALLQVPNTATLHVPILATLTIRNNHPTRSANILLQLDTDTLNDGFVVAGLRSGRIPILLPGTEEVVRWNLVPVECGWVKVPKIKVTNRRKDVIGNGPNSQPEDETEVESVQVIDVRWDSIPEDYVAREGDAGVRKSSDVPKIETTHGRSHEAMVLVLPP